MEAGPRQLVGQRLDRHHVGCLRFLPFVEAFRFRIEAHRKIGGFDESPGQVLVTVLGVPFAFLLAITGVHAIAATGV